MARRLTAVLDKRFQVAPAARVMIVDRIWAPLSGLRRLQIGTVTLQPSPTVPAFSIQPRRSAYELAADRLPWNFLHIREDVIMASWRGWMDVSTAGVPVIRRAVLNV
ncbi:glycine/D-amino acid oxidase-like deaminating enzyme [Microvirga lupini]|uniref:Glycine/D-amino acid oxidase-like deaminating enzyme n=1 Tax=Microvirga lupini TaxID=420324 RepID=A0A7W4VL14_9HYPH|nr:glycine/D-amino acid oxidase-like deaminating enzyme [Microvirga lupini]